MAISTAPRPAGPDIETHLEGRSLEPGRPWVDGSTALLVDHVMRRLINRVSADAAFFNNLLLPYAKRTGNPKRVG